MNFGDIFRGFFGQPRRDGFQRYPEQDDEEENLGRGFFGGHPPFFGGQEDEDGEDNPGFNFEFRFTEPDDMMRHFDEMFRNFDAMFRDMGIAQFPSMRPDFPGIEPGRLPPTDPSSRQDTLRDRMLKIPHRDRVEPSTPSPGDDRHRRLIVPDPNPVPQQPQLPQPPSGFFGGWAFPSWGQNKPKLEERTDSDLDEQVKRGDLSKLLPDLTIPHQMEPPPPKRSLFRGLSVHTYRSADGRVEERKTVQDNDKEESTVTRSIGDQSHSVTTVTDKDGSQHVTENYSNMNEKDRPVFEQFWRSPATSSKSTALVKRDDLNDTSIINQFFTYHFPGFGSNR